MPRLVADTHAVVWHLTAPRKLGAAAGRATGSRLVSVDPVFDGRGVERVWD